MMMMMMMIMGSEGGGAKSHNHVHKPPLLKRNGSRSESNWCPSANQTSVLPLDHTGSQRDVSNAHSFSTRSQERGGNQCLMWNGLSFARKLNVEFTLPVITGRLSSNTENGKVTHRVDNPNTLCGVLCDRWVQLWCDRLRCDCVTGACDVFVGTLWLCDGCVVMM